MPTCYHTLTYTKFLEYTNLIVLNLEIQYQKILIAMTNRMQ